MSTGQSNRICHETGNKTEECCCFICGYQQGCERYSTELFEYKRDHTGAYADTEVCKECMIGGEDIYGTISRRSKK